jgi:hypothetical protein
MRRIAPRAVPIVAHCAALQSQIIAEEQMTCVVIAHRLNTIKVSLLPAL